jgi:hypothetical protein
MRRPHGCHIAGLFITTDILYDRLAKIIVMNEGMVKSKCNAIHYKYKANKWSVSNV